MFSRASLITFLVLCSILIWVPAHTTTPIYSWQDATGTITFSDNPAKAPSDAKVVIGGEYLDPQPPAETALTEAVASELPKRPSHVVTQGEFALQLVQELGLSKPASAKEAADLLTSVRVAPQLGRWELDQPMTPELTIRLRTLTLASAKQGTITATPEEALLAFDTAAALLDAPFPAAPPPKPPAPESPEAPQSPETLEAPLPTEPPYPGVEVPQVIYLYPPPPKIYPYYIWTPIYGGFWWNSFLFPGFFALNVDLFCFNHFHQHFSFRGQFMAVNASGIQRQFRGQIAGNRFSGRVLASSRPGRVPSGVRSASVSNRMINPGAGLRQGSRLSGLQRYGNQPSRTFGSQRAAMARSMYRRQYSSVNSVRTKRMAGSGFPSYSARRFNSSAFARPQSSFSGAGHFGSSMSQGFNTGMHGGGIGRSVGRGSLSRR